MLVETQDEEQVIARVAALDIGKAELVCCVRVPDEDRPVRRLQEVETYSTMTRSLLGMADHLACLGVTRVVMEATSDYWKPAFYLLEAAGFETWLVNAKDVKHLPGRPKTDKLGNATGHGNRYLARVLGNAAASAGRTDTFLGERYRRIARRRGSKKAVVATGRSMLVIIWHLLADPATRYTDLGSDFYQTRINPERRKRNHVRQLEALGYTVILEPAA